MKYVVGYYGDFPELEDTLTNYCNLPENNKINCVNIANMDK